MRLVLPLVVSASMLAHANDDLRAQESGQSSRQLFASREELRREIALADSIASHTSRSSLRQRKLFESALLTHRLDDGDFAAGDQIVLLVEGHPTLSDTFTVRAGRLLPLPDLPAADLSGILRSELPAHLSAHVGRFVRSPRVEATSLVRLAVLGPVQRPGFYALPADMLISQAIMRAGGPTADADLSRTEVRRAGAAIWSAGELRLAIADGYTIDQLHLRAGDEIVVGERQQRNWMGMLQVVTVTLSAAATIFALSR